MGARDLQAGDDQDIRDALDGPMPHETEMPVQKIEGDPDAGMSALDKLGKLLSDQQPPVMFRAENRERLGDLASGLAGGITADLDQRLPFGIGDAIREDRDAAKKRNPGQVTAGEVVGTALSPIGIEGKGATFAATVGRQATTGAMQGAAHAIGDATADEDLQTQAWKALAGGAAGGGVGTVLGGVVGGAGHLLGDAADRARTAAIGASGADLTKLAKSRGLDFVEGNVGKMPDELGVTNKLWPVSPSGYADRLAARGTQANEAITGSLADAETQLSDKLPGAKSRVLDEMRHGALDPSEGDIGQEAGAGAAREAVANDMARRPMDTLEDMRALKTSLDKSAFKNGSLQDSSASMMGQAQRAGGDAVRGEMRDLMSQASPDANARFTQGNEDYGKASLLGELAQKRAAQQYAGGGMLGNLAGGAIGAGIGYGFGGPATAAAGAGLGMVRPALAAAQHYGPDLGANLGRLGESALTGVGDSPAIAKLGGALASKESTASAQDVSNESRGQLIPEAIQSALRGNQLGPYSQQFAKAAMSPDANSLGGLYETLSQTDPQFAPYQRMLQKMTAEEDR